MGSLHWPATKFWNKEVVLLEKCAFNSNGVSKTEDYELTSEERLQVINLLIKLIKLKVK